jgi:nitroreductase
MEVFDAVRTLLAVRNYRDKPVPPEIVRRIVEAGRLTGSSMNLGHYSVRLFGSAHRQGREKAQVDLRGRPPRAIRAALWMTLVPKDPFSPLQD